MSTDIDLSEFEGTEHRVCKLARTLADLDTEHQLKLQAALDKESISADRIVGALHTWGYSVRSTTVRAHRREACTCYAS